MRGSLLQAEAAFWHCGIIPAHAGLTGTSCPACPRCWDHPRACGAHRHISRDRSCSSGSSPRMRGSPQVFHSVKDGAGIIPAHAGLTQANPDGRKPGRDHPRACGAHMSVKLGISEEWGSSPRMRGSLGRCRLLSVPDRIIPAHAGLTYYTSA